MIVDDLSRIAMASNLAGSLSRATDYARAQGHAEVTLEHMLLALCDDPDAVLVLAASNVNVAERMKEVGGQLSALPTGGVHGQGVELIVAPYLRRILEAAAAAARGGRRREINGAIVLRPSSATARAPRRTCCVVSV
jgi:ATP-dependent Clp protease ATP-binding subunit ClpA